MTGESLPLFEGGLTVFILLLALLIVAIIKRPGVVNHRGGRILVFSIFLVMPILALVAGTSTHLEKSKTTAFCLSCHVMEPYGKTLLIDDSDEYLPASHYQNNRITRDHACYSCHTTYTMFGDVRAKMNGFKHLLVNYVGTLPDEIELYEPYDNRECLHCHDDGRDFEDVHEDDREDLITGETSCLECHDLAHPIDEVAGMEMWKETVR